MSKYIDENRLHLRERAEIALAYYSGLQRGARFKLAEAMMHSESARRAYVAVTNKYDEFSRSTLGKLSWCHYCTYCHINPCAFDRQEKLYSVRVERDAADRVVSRSMRAAQAVSEAVDTLEAFLDQAWNLGKSRKRRSEIKGGLATAVLTLVRNSEVTIRLWQTEGP